jgi:endonuclease/exonuclease/phosphatase family metal-dependent hydrolase
LELDGERIAQRVELRPDLHILNVHLTHLQGLAGDDLRARQIGAALDWCHAPTGPDLLVAGDLNAAAAAPALTALFGASDCERGPDACAADAPSFQGERESDFRPFPAIDHCVLRRRSGAWRIIECGRGLNRADAETGLFPSDHAAIVVTLERANP